MTALIWDLDGTVLDSYSIILDSTLRTLAEAGVSVERRELHRRLIASSVRDVLREIGARYSLNADALWRRVDGLDRERNDEVGLMEGAAEALERLSKMGVRSFVYTHNSRASLEVLERRGVLKYFEYALTSEAGLPRKPAPDGIEWLVRRFSLDKSQTFYIGDRPIDAKCAQNAGVGFLLFKPPASPAIPTGTERVTVTRLTEVPGFFQREG